MSKLGTQFELVVSDVVKEMDPNSTVTQGEWIEGPDGRRELDVIIEGTVDGVARRIQIECKDYNPDSRPIGIAIIDALESKHRDLNFDLSLLCSNAGFTTDAIRKAKRKGIGLIGVLRDKDERIRYRIMDEVYIRRLDHIPVSNGIKFFWNNKPPPKEVHLEEIMYKGVPVISWLISRIYKFIAFNPIVKGTFTLCFRFKRPIKFTFPSGSADVNKMQIKFEISGGWVAQKLEINATCGLYDWIRRTIHLSPNPAKVTLKNVKFGEGGTAIECPPDFDPDILKQKDKGGISIWICDIGGLGEPKIIPKLDKFVMDIDLVEVRNDIPNESYYS